MNIKKGSLVGYTTNIILTYPWKTTPNQKKKEEKIRKSKENQSFHV